MEKTLARYGTFNLFHQLLQRHYNEKMASNIISALHASGSILLSNRYLKTKQNFNSLIFFSTGYFLFDILNMLRNKRLTSPLQWGYVYHHLTSIYLLHYGDYERTLAHIFLYAELSNLTTYPLYHYLHKTGNHKRKIMILKLAQKVVYTGIRIPLLTYLFYHFMRKKRSNSFVYPVFSLYLMGVIWSMKIVSQ